MPEGAHRFQVGSVYCAVLADGYCSYPSSWLFPNADPGVLSIALAARGAPLDSIVTPCACMLVEAGRHAALVDTGGGNASPSTGGIMARLEMQGLRPKDVDTVILTHVHPDNAGGAVDSRGRPAFPNARYVISEKEWDFWTSGRASLGALRIPERAKDRLTAGVQALSLEALRCQVETIDGETQLLPGVRAIPAPGHTPGHLAVEIVSDGDGLLDLGDAAAHPLHLAHPDWGNGFDLEPETAVATRAALLKRAADGGMRVMAFHFPFPSVGRIRPATDSGWDWIPGW